MLGRGEEMCVCVYRVKRGWVSGWMDGWNLIATVHIQFVFFSFFSSLFVFLSFWSILSLLLIWYYTTTTCFSFLTISLDLLQSLIFAESVVYVILALRQRLQGELLHRLGSYLHQAIDALFYSCTHRAPFFNTYSIKIPLRNIETRPSTILFHPQTPPRINPNACYQRRALHHTWERKRRSVVQYKRNANLYISRCTGINWSIPPWQDLYSTVVSLSVAGG